VGGRIVLADDNAEMRSYVSGLLRAAGHEVMETHDGAAALEETRLRPPDLVIADVMMPGLDGFGLAAALRSDVRTAGLPLILLSARAGEDARIEGLAAGADDYLVKPFSARELVARVDGGLRLTRLRRDMEGQLRQVQKMEAVGQLTGGIAHDFNNLLTAILGGLDLILKRTEDERIRRLAENGLAAAERGAKLASQLLAFSRTQRLQIQAVDLRAVLDQAREAVARAVGPAVALDISIDDAGRFVMADSAQVELALVNLAANARDAMPDGGRLSIAVATREVEGDPELPPGRYSVLSVTDTGEGMSPEVADRAFDPFFSTRGVGKGSGLGLSQVYATARKCGGVARIESRPQAGAAVRIFLPAAEPAEEAARPQTAKAEGAVAERGGATVLVIDDDELVRRLFVEGLQDGGFRVIEASDGRAGLELLDRDPPDVMVVDYAMPGMNGGEVARLARARWPDLPILFATGFADSADLALIPGAVVLGKPLTLPTLTAALDRALTAAAGSSASRPAAASRPA
jgi:DNA-binding response OmpR family regulator